VAHWLGLVPYGEALALQEQQLVARQTGREGDVVLLLEHPPVVTLGRSTRRENLLASPDELAARGIELHEIARGGDVTYHAPGQLVGYPIVDLAARDARDVHAFLRQLEEALIEALATLAIAAERVEGKTGVFVQRKAPGERLRKIASIGIGVRRWVTWHGFALNVSLDLSGFDVIVPCGLEGIDMTSVAAELERAGRSVPDDLDERARAAVSAALAARWS
jgi:lipoyl(octanoyl) transferase